MQLHHLAITAFGPFADTVEVDLDALAEAQVFLLCGPVGSGKTTVLDAVCFALYGEVPAERGRARQLRSHFAADGVAPRVVLEATIDGRRFRFARSPAWERPKKRGDGTTTQQPSALVEERVEGGWRVLASRLDEAGALAGDLIGMTLPQFSQVAMLPQGQFDTFLRATSEDRQRILTRLFRTQRFEQVERWLVERRSELRRDSERRAGDVSVLLHRTSEAAGVELPDWDDLAATSDSGEVGSWLEQLTTDAVSNASGAGHAREAAESLLSRAVAEDETARRRDELRGRHRRAVARHERLEATRLDHVRDQDRLDAARRAALVVVPRRGAEAAETAAATADLKAVEALTAAADVLEGEPVDLDRQAVAAAERAAVAAGFVPRARQLLECRRRLQDLDVETAASQARRDGLAADAAAIPARISAAEATVVALREQAADLEPLRARLVDLARRTTRFATLTELEFQVSDFVGKRDQQQTVVLDLRQRLLDVREARLHGMAAELAAGMAVGASCPVCGSHEHPAPATAPPGTPDDDLEQQVQSLLDDAEVTLETHRDQVRSYTTRRDVVAGELAGSTLPQTETELRATEADAAVATGAGRELAPAEQRVRDLREQHHDAAAAVAALDAELARLGAERRGVEQTAGRLDDELTALMGPDQVGNDVVVSVTELARHDRRTAALLTSAHEALTDRTRSRRHADQTRSAAEQAARDHGFGSAAEAAEAELDSPAIAALDADVAQRVREETEVAALLSDPDISAAAAAPADDLEALAERRRLAAIEHTTAATAADLAERRRARLLEQGGALRVALTRWAPVRAEYRTVRSLSELVEGKGSDNAAQMRLSAYVLAARLGQVVDAANQQLSRMTDGRFLLVHTARRGVGERRGGLSLLVEDLWTDRLRDPVTLSGGETFLVSLALALGLAEVVTNESGGTAIGTLFVDEGFGMLDDDALELVMDTLDELRSGGRVVGVVSHVPELRTRIPAQLVVSKGRAGSTLELRR